MPMDLISQKEARSAGDTFYYTGKPCKHGHDSRRYVSSGHCVKCHVLKMTSWRERNPTYGSDQYQRTIDARREGMRQYQIKNREALAEYGKAYREANTDKLKAKQQRYYNENKEAFAVKGREYRQANKDKVRQRKAAWSANNRDIMNASLRKFKQANPEKVAADVAKRRARKLAATPERTQACVAWELQAHKTRLRLKKITGYEWQVDHMTPLAIGGLHVSTNLQVIPAVLNLRKSKRAMYTRPNEWMQDWKMSDEIMAQLKLLDMLPRK